MTKHREDSKVILMGDFNIQKKHSPQRKEIFNRIATDLGLVINTPDTYTITDYKGAKSMLDYILCSPEIKTSKIDVYHLDRFPGNSSTHSPIFATIEFEGIPVTEKLTSELKESMDSPFSNYLSRKRPNWDNIDMTLFHKIVNIKSNAVWHTIQREKVDIRLNAIINILVVGLFITK